jgi:hypothetical protein
MYATMVSVNSAGITVFSCLLQHEGSLQTPTGLGLFACSTSLVYVLSGAQPPCFVCAV